MTTCPKFLDPTMVCGQLGICMKSMKDLVASPTCEDCTGGVAAVANILIGETEEIIAFLNVQQIVTEQTNPCITHFSG